MAVEMSFEETAAGSLPIREMHDRLYAGAVLRFRQMPEMRRIVLLTRAFIEEQLHPLDPQLAHRHFPADALAERVAALRRDYARLPEAGQAWRELFEAIGFDPAGTARDRLQLRFQVHRELDDASPARRSTATVNFHRDTWGTNLYAQINWWAPVYPITAGRTFAFYPVLWDRPLANSSPDFDMAEAMRLVRENVPELKPGQIVPRLLEQVDSTGARPVVIDPGEIIAFSSQHAHAGVPNHSGFTRISLETRTLLIEDHRSGRGAPNVDGRARWQSPGLFRMVNDGTPLTEKLGVERLVPFTGPWPEGGRPA